MAFAAMCGTAGSPLGGLSSIFFGTLCAGVVNESNVCDPPLPCTVKTPDGECFPPKPDTEPCE